MLDGRVADIILIAVTFCAAFYMLATEDAEADTPTGSHASVELGANEAYTSVFGNWYPRGSISRQMNGTLWVFHANVVTYSTDIEIIGSFSTDNGVTWSNITIIDNSDPEFAVGGTPWEAMDWVMLSNNSIILLVVLKGYDTVANRELHYLCHWNNSDLSQWEEILVYASASYNIDYDACHVAVNGDDEVMVTYPYRNDRLDWELWDFSDRSHLDTTWYPFVCRAYANWLMCNTTGVFLFAYGNGASPEYIYLFSLVGAVKTALYNAGASSSYWAWDAIVTADDTFVCIFSHTAGGSARLIYWNTTSSGTRYIQESPYTDGHHHKLSIQNDSDVNVWVLAYHNTDDRFVLSSNPYYRNQQYWKDSKTEVWDETLDTTYDYIQAGSTDLFPMFMVDGEEIRTQLPNSGYIWFISDYDAADDRDWHIVRSSSMTWPAIPWYFGPAPNITTVALDGGTFNEYYLFGISGEDGETPYIWSLLVTPAWLHIGSANGSLYGLPGATGNFPVTIRLTETHDAPRLDDQAYSLHIGAGEGEGEGDGDGDVGVGTGWAIPQSLMSDLWMLFIVTAMFVGVATAFRKYMDRLKGWQGAQYKYRNYRRPIYSGYRKPKRPAPRPKHRYKY